MPTTGIVWQGFFQNLFAFFFPPFSHFPWHPSSCWRTLQDPSCQLGPQLYKCPFCSQRSAWGRGLRRAAPPAVPTGQHRGLLVSRDSTGKAGKNVREVRWGQSLPPGQQWEHVNVDSVLQGFPPSHSPGLHRRGSVCHGATPCFYWFSSSPVPILLL